MKRILVLFLLLIYSPFLYSTECACDENQIEEKSEDKVDKYLEKYEKVPIFMMGEPIYYQKHRLNRSYLDSSDAELKDFLNGWQEESKGVDKKELKNYPEVIQHAYKIFEDFYQPKSLDRIGKPEWGTEQFEKVKYLVVQNDLKISVNKKLSKSLYEVEKNSILELTVNDFKPNVAGDTPALFLTDEYERILNNFLGSESHPFASGGIMNPARAKGESEKRQQFLNSKLKIYHGHWNGWNLVTDPTITSINFNKYLKKAVVHFSLVYEGGHAIYKLKDGKWILVESKLTWIT